MVPKKIARNILLFIFCISVLNVNFVFGANILQENGTTYLRWNIFAEKDDVLITKSADGILIQTLRVDIFNDLKKSIKNLNVSNKYIKSIEVDNLNHSNKISGIRLLFSGQSIEVFNFYRSSEKKHIIDFWHNKSEESENKIIVDQFEKQKNKKIKLPKRTISNKKKISVIANVKQKKKSTVKNKILQKKNRDFRYGSSLVWDYSPFVPKLNKEINLTRKTPEYFYPIKDRDYEENDRESHLQLSINLYRKKKWGLMYKSIKLYYQKYGDDADVDFNDYLKANALIRNTEKNNSIEPTKMAINILLNIFERSDNYSLVRSVAKYLISFYMSERDNVKSLEISKKLYVKSREKFEVEDSKYAVKIILYNLSELNQIGIIRELIKEQSTLEIIPKQTSYSYEIYTLLKQGNYKEAIKFYERKESSLIDPVAPSILYNVAESYFRESKLEKAIKLYDKFIANYSYTTATSNARVRVALCYEMLNKNFDQTVELYKNAINKSQNKEVQYEAKIRYVAMRNLRKIITNDLDKEVRVFLNDSLPKTTKLKYPKIKTLLWLVRLRMFIVDKKWKKALSYLNAIPLNILRPVERRVFEGDGVEIIRGMILDNYKKGEYSKIIQIWEVYKSKYISKVAQNPYLNFIVGKSFIKVGLYNNFDLMIDGFKKYKKTPVKTFPNWIGYESKVKVSKLLLELEIIMNIRLKNWAIASKKILKLNRIDSKYNKLKYYKAKIAFHSKDYKKVIGLLENYLSDQKYKTIYDRYEIAELIKIYTDSLYNTKNYKKFKKIVTAAIRDTDDLGDQNDYLKEVRERCLYLYIELIAKDLSQENSLNLEVEILKFKKIYNKSIYLGKLNYLLGLSYFHLKRIKESKKIFNEILSDKNVTEYIKNLVKTELSVIRIQEKTI